MAENVKEQNNQEIIKKYFRQHKFLPRHSLLIAANDAVLVLLQNIDMKFL
jgi:hypothetical protein